VGKGALWLALVSGDGELLLVLKGGAGLSASMVVLVGGGVGEEEGMGGTGGWIGPSYYS